MDIKALKSKLLWQMTGEEFLFLQQNGGEQPERQSYVVAPSKKHVYGIRGIAELFGCSIPTANRIKRSGKIDRAITQIGRKIIVDTYGGYARHGGGAFSGKDPSKVDRSAAYATRWVAKNIVAAGLAKQCEVQVAYAIGVAKPVSIMVDTFGTGTVADEKIEQAVEKVFDLTPAAIIRDLGLRKPIYRKLAAYGHMGREDLGVKWENTDRVDELKAAVAAL